MEKIRWSGQKEKEERRFISHIFNIWTHIVTTAHPSSWKQKQQGSAPPPLYANLYPSKYFPFYCYVLLLLFILEFTTTDCVKTNGGQFEFSNTKGIDWTKIKVERSGEQIYFYSWEFPFDHGKVFEQRFL